MDARTHAHKEHHPFLPLPSVFAPLTARQTHSPLFACTAFLSGIRAPAMASRFERVRPRFIPVHHRKVRTTNVYLEKVRNYTKTLLWCRLVGAPTAHGRNSDHENFLLEMTCAPNWFVPNQLGVWNFLWKRIRTKTEVFFKKKKKGNIESSRIRTKSIPIATLIVGKDLWSCWNWYRLAQGE